MKHTNSYRKGHPNPQFFREDYLLLNGDRDFCFDDEDEGIDKEYYLNFPTDSLLINVPYPYQAKKSLLRLKCSPHCFQHVEVKN